MATELDISTLKSGDSLYFKAAGRFPFWTPEKEQFVMDKIFENVLEGTAHSWGPGDPNTNPFRFPPREWAKDADEAPINASKIGSLAGSYQNKTETDSTGQVWLKVDFPFTFLNRDGSNHDQKSTIIAWVKVEDVEIKEDMETQLKKLLAEDPNNKDLFGNGKGKDDKPKSPWGYLIAFFVLVGGSLFFWNKNKKEKQAQAYQQDMSQSKPFYKNVRL